MKTFLVRLQILGIILLVFSPLIYLGLKKFTPQINLLKYDLNHRSTMYPSLPPLHTIGIQIVDDKNKPVVLRGFNLISTNWGENYKNWNPQAVAVASHDWHANVIRTRIYQHEFETNPSQFFLDLETQILTPARQNGLYVIIHPWFGENGSLPDSKGVMMWLAVAKRYAEDPHIIYDLLAEPRDISFDELRSVYTSLIPKIRSIAPGSLIMVTGLDWGRDINAWLDSPLPYNNIVYRANPYNRTAEFPGYFGKIARTYPIFLGEFGTDNKLSMGESDVKNILAYADALGIGWTAWHFTSSGCPCLLTSESDFKPSAYGQLIKSSLSGTTTTFTLPTFDPSPDKLYVYSDFFESGFADYSWGITNQFGVNIKTNFHNSSGLYFNTSRRIDPSSFSSFYLTFKSLHPELFTLRFKSYDNQLSRTFFLQSGENILSTADIDLKTLSGVVIETAGTIPDPTPITLDQIYFQK